MNHVLPADMVNEKPMPPHFTAQSHYWLEHLDRRLRRQRRATLLASGIAGCLAIVAIAEALLWGWK